MLNGMQESADIYQLPIPIFLISFNRGEMLLRAIAGLRKMAQPIQIIVHDNGSTDEATLEILNQLEKIDISVLRYGPIHTADCLNQVDETVRAFFAGKPKQSYVVSDCDIDLGIADPSTLSLYAELLDLFPETECVGPMLRIRDVTPSYPLFNHVMNRHIEQFWHRHPSWVHTSFGLVAYLDATIDTTLALHRSGQPFRRLKKGLRVYEPYEALHLDWYNAPNMQDNYASSSSPDISHWNNATERERYRDVLLNYSRFIAVKMTPDGLVEYEETIPPTSDSACET